MFLFMAFAATQVANASAPATAAGSNTLTQTPNTANLLYISLAFGFSLTVNAWAFFRISGGLFNPAVSDTYSTRTGCRVVIMVETR
jgi:aquaporin related protein